MYCKNCGKELELNGDGLCKNCYSDKGEEGKYCPECGAIEEDMTKNICMKCGCSLQRGNSEYVEYSGNRGGIYWRLNFLDRKFAPKDKTKIGRNRKVAVLLALFLGVFGAHRFYMGRRATGVITLLVFLILLPSGKGWIWEGLALLDMIWILIDRLKPIKYNFIRNDK